MDPLTQALMKRQMGQAPATAQGFAPAPSPKFPFTDREGAMPSPPPNVNTKTPPAWQRWATAEKMKDAYANNWTPNPMAIRMNNTREG